MRFRNTVAVAVIFFALGAYLYFVESEKIREEADGERLVDVDPDDVTAVTLEYPAEERTIELRKTAAGWQIRKPLEAPADDGAVQNLIRAIAEAELKRALEGEIESLETYGLEKPEAIVRVELDDGSTRPAIRVGKSAPVGYSAFVQLEGEPAVKLVPSTFATGMKKEVTELRDKAILSFEPSDVRRIRVDADEDGADAELVREGESWTYAGTTGYTPDEDEIRMFLTALRSLRAEDFLDPPVEEETGIEAPRRKIVLTTGEGENAKTLELHVGAEGDRDGKRQIYVQKPGEKTVYTVANYAWANLGKTRNAFRDKTVLAFEPENLGALEVMRADGSGFRLVRREAPAKDGDGTEKDGESAEASWIVEDAADSTRSAEAAQLVGDVHGLKGYEIAAESPEDLSAFGLGAPRLAFSLFDRKGEPIGRILVAQVEGDGEDGERRSYAMAEGGTLVFRLRDYLYAHVDKKREDLVEPPPAAEEPAGEADAATPATP